MEEYEFMLMPAIVHPVVRVKAKTLQLCSFFSHTRNRQLNLVVNSPFSA